MWTILFKYFFRLIFITSFFHISLLGAQCPQAGPWIATDDTNGEAELIMTDVMVPQKGLKPSTYYSTLNFKIGNSGGYAGIQYNKYRPLNNIFSIWDFPNGTIKASYQHQNTVVNPFGNEGTGLHSHNDFGWKPNNWYTTVVSKWYNNGANDTQVGFWIYDHTQAIWEHYVTFSVPEPDAKLYYKYYFGFVENWNFNDGIDSRYAYFKQPWRLSTQNQWVKPKKLTVTAKDGNVKGWNAKRFQGDGVITYACGENNANSSTIEIPYFNFSQKPTILKPLEVLNLSAKRDTQTNLLDIAWEIDKSKNPQLGFTVKLYENSTQSQPFYSYSIYKPEQRSLQLQLNNINEYKTYYAVIEYIDIFRQKITKTVQIESYNQQNINTTPQVTPNYTPPISHQPTTITQTKEDLCEAGDGESCFELAADYTEGTNGKSKDKYQAYLYYYKGCNFNFAASCFLEGFFYEDGTIVDKDIPRAIKTYKKGCDLGGCYRSCDAYNRLITQTQTAPTTSSTNTTDENTVVDDTPEEKIGRVLGEAIGNIIIDAISK